MEDVVFVYIVSFVILFWPIGLLLFRSVVVFGSWSWSRGTWRPLTGVLSIGIGFGNSGLGLGFEGCGLCFGLWSCCWSWHHMLNQLFIIFHVFCRIQLTSGIMYQIADKTVTCNWNQWFTYCYSVFRGCNGPVLIGMIDQSYRLWSWSWSWDLRSWS